MSRKSGPAPVAVHSRQSRIPFRRPLEASCCFGKLFSHSSVNSQIVVTTRDQGSSLFCKLLQLLHLCGSRHPRPLERTPLDLLTTKFRSSLDVALGEQLFGYL